MRKKGFTLIELLAVIIILAVIALITTPIILNVVEEAKSKANIATANAYLDAAYLYYTESMLNETKRVDIDQVNNIYEKVSMKGEKPAIGQLYVNKNGKTALAMILDGKCYYQEFYGQLGIKEEGDCDLGWVGVDEVIPTLTAKDGQFIITEGDNIASDTYFHEPVFGPSGGVLVCDPANTSNLTVGTHIITCVATGTNGKSVRADKEIKVKSKIYHDNSGANIPELVDGMIPVTYNGTNWVYANIQKEWYNYTNREWANAVVLNSGVTKNVGNTIAENEIALWFVWIPRFEYSIPEYNLGRTDSDIRAIDVKFIDKNKTEADSGYSIHPGFIFDEKDKNGIWIGKFESSAPNVILNAAQKISIKPNVVSWRGVTLNSAFVSSQNIAEEQNLLGVDSHIARYLEWTTVSYITNSVYGRCSDPVHCTEVTINSNSGYMTGGGDYFNNNNQSTTGNIYGVYDMSGGAWEFVMGNYANHPSLSGYTASTMPAKKYYDVFLSTEMNANTYNYLSAVNDDTSMRGVIKELIGPSINSYSNSTWYNDEAYSINPSNSWFIMGGNFNIGASAGIFSSNYSSGIGIVGANNSISFRVVITTE